MHKKQIYYLISFVLVLALASDSAMGGVAYPVPDAWWTYIYTGDAAEPGLDGTWDHDNGSDEWDGSPIGVTGTEPGGVSALTEDNTHFVRIQDVFDHDPGDEPSNRKIYFAHDIGAEGAANNVVDAVTLSFRARIPTTPPLDPLNGNAGSPWPEGGDGYIIHHEGKGNFSIGDVDDRLISFSLALDTDDAALSEDGLIMNNLNGTSPSGDVDTGEGGTLNQLVLDPTEWHEFWITIEADTSGGGTHKVTIWIDGDVENPSTFHVTAGRGDRAYETINYLALGAGNTNHNGAFDVDFFAYKEGILTPADIYTASNPTPADGAMIEDTWINLSWIQGASATSHDVYLGDNYDIVSNATTDSDIFRGNQTDTFYVAGFPGFAYPEGLIPGKTYYWRIDEVEADGITKYKGNVWSFSIPPKTAYNPDPANNAENVGPDNVTLSWTPGYGAKLHTVFIGNDYDQVSNTVVGMMQGTTTYNAGTLEAEKVYYWRVDEFDAVETHKGPVWTFTTPGAVSAPQPADGAVGASMTTALSWTAATNATSHDVYLGLDKEAVRNADTSSPEYQGNAALGSESVDPGKLAWLTLYYWRVDAVTSAGPVKGPIWSFTTADFISVDDFESYTDDDVAGEAIWQSWIDGFGVADNGAQAGNLLPPYCEQTIVHGGAQSMPLFYTNEAGVTNSEATLTLTETRDWTEEGVGELSLWVRGSSANAADPLYVSVANAAGTPAIMANDDPVIAQKGSWIQWVIPLQAFADQGINLVNVDKIALGLGSKSGMAASGGTGTMYIDDIALFRLEP